MSMLDVTSYERNILKTANKLLEYDAYNLEKELLKIKSKNIPGEKIAMIEQIVEQEQQQQQQAQQPQPQPQQHQHQQQHLVGMATFDNSESKMPLLHKLLRKDIHHIPHTDFGGHVEINRLYQQDSRIIGMHLCSFCFWCFDLRLLNRTPSIRTDTK
jgi:hypothetical protein